MDCCLVRKELRSLAIFVFVENCDKIENYNQQSNLNKFKIQTDTHTHTYKNDTFSKKISKYKTKQNH